MQPCAQELQFYTKAYTILDGKMMLSEIEALPSPRFQLLQGIGFPSPLPGEDVKQLAAVRNEPFRWLRYLDDAP